LGGLAKAFGKLNKLSPRRLKALGNVIKSFEAEKKLSKRMNKAF
jgi:hypothetical protein